MASINEVIGMRFTLLSLPVQYQVKSKWIIVIIIFSFIIIAMAPAMVMVIVIIIIFAITIIIIIVIVIIIIIVMIFIVIIYQSRWGNSIRLSSPLANSMEMAMVIDDADDAGDASYLICISHCPCKNFSAP